MIRFKKKIILSVAWSNISKLYRQYVADMIWVTAWRKDIPGQRERGTVFGHGATGNRCVLRVKGKKVGVQSVSRS